MAQFEFLNDKLERRSGSVADMKMFRSFPVKLNLYSIILEWLEWLLACIIRSEHCNQYGNKTFSYSTQGVFSALHWCKITINYFCLEKNTGLNLTPIDFERRQHETQLRVDFKSFQMHLVFISRKALEEKLLCLKGFLLGPCFESRLGSFGVPLEVSTVSWPSQV